MKNESGWTDTVTAVRQRHYMQPLPAGQGVKQNGETFYSDPDTIHHQVYTGYRVQYQGSWSTSLKEGAPALLIRSMAIKISSLA